MKYNYQKEVTASVLDYIAKNFSPEEIAEKLQDRPALVDELDALLWSSDSVTGNASGSYYCSRWKAEEALCHNLDLLAEAFQEWCIPTKKLYDPEYCDLTIRCYILGNCINAALDELQKN